MKLSTKTRYATRAMIELARHYPDQAVSARQIAARQSVSLKYLESLLTSLRSAGLTRSIRGPQGGHVLARPPDQINLWEIYCVFEGAEGFVECTTSPERCARIDTCPTTDVWSRLHASAMAILETTSLEQLARRAIDTQDECN